MMLMILFIIVVLWLFTWWVMMLIFSRRVLNINIWAFPPFGGQALRFNSGLPSLPPLPGFPLRSLMQALIKY